MRSQEPFEQCRWLFSCANHNSLCLQVSGTKVWVKRRTSRMPNLRLMSKIYYYRLLALGSTRVKFDVWRGTKKLQIIRPRATTNSWETVLAFLPIGDFVWYLHEFAINVIIISSFCFLRLCCWRLKMANAVLRRIQGKQGPVPLEITRKSHHDQIAKHVYIFLNFQQYFTNQ